MSDFRHCLKSLVFPFFLCCASGLWQITVQGCFLHDQCLWLHASDRLCHSWLWRHIADRKATCAVVTVAEAVVNIVLNFSDCLNTAGASQGTGFQRCHCPFSAFGVQLEKSFLDSWYELELFMVHPWELWIQWCQWEGRASTGHGWWVSPQCSGNWEQLCGATREWQQTEIRQEIIEATQTGSLGWYCWLGNRRAFGSPLTESFMRCASGGVTPASLGLRCCRGRRSAEPVHTRFPAVPCPSYVSWQHVTAASARWSCCFLGWRFMLFVWRSAESTITNDPFLLLWDIIHH